MTAMRLPPRSSPTLAALFAGLCAGLSAPAQAEGAWSGLKACRLPGVEHAAQCGVLRRPLDPAEADGRTIDLHVAVLPAVARNKKADPVLFFAGGPGQSAIDLAGPLSRLLARLSNRRDVVLIDQRGTGRSAPLKCPDQPATQSLRELADPPAQVRQLDACRKALQALPHGDLRYYTTTLAMQDADAVRQALGYAKVNLVGASYGTRAALEYMRQFPRSVRRAVIDGVAPPAMALPTSFSTDAQAAFEGLLGWCAKDPVCAATYPRLRESWAGLLKSLPREVSLRHPLTDREERVTLGRDGVTAMVRLPLYAPHLASALPLAVTEAAGGRFDALAGLSGALVSGARSARLAQGMHFSVICAEDMPRLERSADQPGADFGEGFADVYRQVCAAWPRGRVPADFYRVAAAPGATLVLSGGIDPVTPPRHGERVARALGSKSRHVVVAQAGHGVLGLGCARDVVFRFIDADDDVQALAVDASCLSGVPRPPAFRLPRPEGAS